MRKWLSCLCLPRSVGGDDLGMQVINAGCSWQYARSENCRMELQFATRSLRKPFLPVICGSGDEWQETAAGMLIQGVECITAQATKDLSVLQEVAVKASKMLESIAGARGRSEPVAGKPSPAKGPETGAVEQPTFLAPRVGNHVLAYHTPTTSAFQFRCRFFSCDMLTLT
jgi:hypothetical protein